MKYLSVCSGIEAATVAWHSLGCEAVAYSEIEPFPSAVLAHHYPDTPNLGDMTKYRGWDSGKIGSIDVLAGGTPCQSFSVAGLRQGLKDPRGNLMLTYLGIADRYRPRWLVWENVPGVLSSDGGRDFGTFLGALAKLGYGWAYRILDAQWFGVAQRRKRVFVVGHLGNASRAAKVLFESESVCRNSVPSREKGKKVAGAIGARTCRSSGVQDAECGHMIAEEEHVATAFEPGIARRIGGESRFTHEFTGTLSSNMGTNQIAVAYSQAIPLDSMNHISRANNHNHSFGDFIDGAPCYTITKNHSHAVCTDILHSTAVRRLTPTECERLQGFPDGYTNIPWRKKTESPDGLRYRALGNSMAVPVMQWIGKRMVVIG
jgi:DNA (cytosine-5)-methyltransferase 1